MGLASFTDAETGEPISINTDGAMIGSIGRMAGNTTIVRHVPTSAGGFVHDQLVVREDFWDVINELAEARMR